MQEAQHDSEEDKRRDLAEALKFAEQDELIRICRGDPRVCTKWRTPDYACCAFVRKVRGLTVDEMMARSKPN